MKPLCIDLYCGLGGWSEGFLAEGYDCIGFDIERHRYVFPEMLEPDGQKHTKPVEKRGWTQGCAVSLGLEGVNAKPRTVRASLGYFRAVKLGDQLKFAVPAREPFGSVLRAV